MNDSVIINGHRVTCDVWKKNIRRLVRHLAKYIFWLRWPSQAKFRVCHCSCDIIMRFSCQLPCSKTFNCSKIETSTNWKKDDEHETFRLPWSEGKNLLSPTLIDHYKKHYFSPLPCKIILVLMNIGLRCYYFTTPSSLWRVSRPPLWRLSSAWPFANYKRQSWEGKFQLFIRSGFSTISP